MDRLQQAREQDHAAARRRARIDRDTMLMEMARTVARRSDCQRAPDGVGAVLALNGRVISTGYAGAPSGAPGCGQDGSGCDPSQPCTRTIHAEVNAIVFAARHGIAVEGATLYCTLAPCQDCAKLIINSGVKQVVYAKLYRSVAGIELLQRHNILVRSFP